MLWVDRFHSWSCNWFALQRYCNPTEPRFQWNRLKAVLTGLLSESKQINQKANKCPKQTNVLSKQSNQMSEANKQIMKIRAMHDVWHEQSEWIYVQSELARGLNLGSWRSSQIWSLNDWVHAWWPHGIVIDLLRFCNRALFSVTISQKLFESSDDWATLCRADIIQSKNNMSRNTNYQT